LQCFHLSLALAPISIVLCKALFQLKVSLGAGISKLVHHVVVFTRGPLVVLRFFSWLLSI
jgi:hypothetical protein